MTCLQQLHTACLLPLYLTAAAAAAAAAAAVYTAAAAVYTAAAAAAAVVQVMTNAEYPERVAINFLEMLLDEFTKVCGFCSGSSSSRAAAAAAAQVLVLVMVLVPVLVRPSTSASIIGSEKKR